MADQKPATTTKSEVYMVNPSGAIHLMTLADAAYRLKWFKGWRKATAEEIKKLNAAKGYQTAEHPLCERPSLELKEPILETEPAPAPSKAK